MRVYHDLFLTEWGWGGAVFSELGARRIVLPRLGRREAERALGEGAADSAGEAEWRDLRIQLREYFAKERRTLSLPVDITAPGAFTAFVWELVRRVPYGRTLTYGEAARKAGRPGAARAVGQALGRNPVPLLIPCHRVVASGGMGGFSDGVAIKTRLLELERRGPLPPRGRRKP